MAKPAKPEAARGVVRRGRITVRYERSALSAEHATAFAALAAQGLRELERIAGLPARIRLRFELRSKTRISTARGRTIELSTYRVASRSAPYLHEIAHVLLPCPHAPPWFSEGLACYLEGALSERGCGYDAHLFTQDGNRGVDADAARWIGDPRGQKVLPFVGTRGMPPGIATDRHNVAAPFYVLTHSLVKFLAVQAGLPSVLRLTRTGNFSRALRHITGNTSALWRSVWEKSLPHPAAGRQSSSNRNTRGG